MAFTPRFALVTAVAAARTPGVALHRTAARFAHPVSDFIADGLHLLRFHVFAFAARCVMNVDELRWDVTRAHARWVVTLRVWRTCVSTYAARLPRAITHAGRAGRYPQHHHMPHHLPPFRSAYLRCVLHSFCIGVYMDTTDSVPFTRTFCNGPSGWCGVLVAVLPTTVTYLRFTFRALLNFAVPLLAPVGFGLPAHSAFPAFLSLYCTFLRNTAFCPRPHANRCTYHYAFPALLHCIHRYATGMFCGPPTADFYSFWFPSHSLRGFSDVSLLAFAATAFYVTAPYSVVTCTKRISPASPCHTHRSGDVCNCHLFLPHLFLSFPLYIFASHTHLHICVWVFLPACHHVFL